MCNVNEVNGKIAVMTEPLKLDYQEYTVPEPGPGAIIAKVSRTNVCGSELHIWRGQHPSLKRGVLGHEMIGQVHKLGEGVTTDSAGEPISIGDRIVATYFLICKKCPACQEGQFNLCENAYYFWTKQPEVEPHFHGTFGTHYYIHPEQYVYKVPDNVPDISAASANCALSQVYFGIDQASLSYGQTIVIQGAGGLGLNAAAVAKEKGATVIVVDALKSRLDQAKEFGADYVIDINDYQTVEQRSKIIQELTNGRGADIGLEVAGVPAAFAEGIHHIRPGGKYITIGNISPGRMVEFDPGLLTRKSIQIIPVIRYNPWYLRKSLEFLSKNIDKYPFDTLLDAEFTLEEVEDALEKSANREITRASIVVNS
ncbi:zinc-binding dehydrogenase [Schinkia azotoformans]|uniref:zinc-binding dehydrogenase n=1 Tax=Schinkia azotoformans TaxID=1454 RepID=UPI002E1EB041|nr:zinc-binding dehydrogenase [Schinkia azotoformans]